MLIKVLIYMFSLRGRDRGREQSRNSTKGKREERVAPEKSDEQNTAERTARGFFELLYSRAVTALSSDHHVPPSKLKKARPRRWAPSTRAAMLGAFLLSGAAAAEQPQGAAQPPEVPVTSRTPSTPDDLAPTQGERTQGESATVASPENSEHTIEQDRTRIQAAFQEPLQEIDSWLGDPYISDPQRGGASPERVRIITQVIADFDPNLMADAILTLAEVAPEKRESARAWLLSHNNLEHVTLYTAQSLAQRADLTERVDPDVIRHWEVAGGFVHPEENIIGVNVGLIHRLFPEEVTPFDPNSEGSVAAAQRLEETYARLFPLVVDELVRHEFVHTWPYDSIDHSVVDEDSPEYWNNKAIVEGIVQLIAIEAKELSHPDVETARAGYMYGESQSAYLLTTMLGKNGVRDAVRSVFANDHSGLVRAFDKVHGAGAWDRAMSFSLPEQSGSAARGLSTLYGVLSVLPTIEQQRVTVAKTNSALEGSRIILIEEDGYLDGVYLRNEGTSTLNGFVRKPFEVSEGHYAHVYVVTDPTLLLEAQPGQKEQGPLAVTDSVWLYSITPIQSPFGLEMDDEGLVRVVNRSASNRAKQLEATHNAQVDR